MENKIEISRSAWRRIEFIFIVMALFVVFAAAMTAVIDGIAVTILKLMIFSAVIFVIYRLGFDDFEIIDTAPQSDYDYIEKGEPRKHNTVNIKENK
jgi:hypothetical protein